MKTFGLRFFLEAFGYSAVLSVLLMTIYFSLSARGAYIYYYEPNPLIVYTEIPTYIFGALFLCYKYYISIREEAERMLK